MIKALIAFLLLSSSAFAETIQIRNAGPAAINTAGNTFLYLTGTSIGTTEAFRQVISPSAGNFRNMRVLLSADPSNGAGVQSVTVALRVAGSSSALSCTISEGSTTCTDSDTVAVTAGQTLGYIVTGTNTPTASNVEVTIEYVDGIAQSHMQNFGAAGDLSATANTYMNLAVSSFSATENNVQLPMPTSGTITALYVALTGSPNNGGGTQSYITTVWKNGSAPAGTLTCTISEAGTTCNDTANSVTFVAGDTISVEVDPVNTPTVRSIKGGLAFNLDREGEFIIACGTDGVMSATATQYKGINGGGSWNATESVVDQASNTFLVSAIYVELSADPDLGLDLQTYDFTIRDDASSTGCTCQVASGATTCNATCDSTVVVDSQMSVEQVPTTLPTAVVGNVGILAFNNPRRIIYIN